MGMEREAGPKVQTIFVLGRMSPTPTAFSPPSRTKWLGISVSLSLSPPFVCVCVCVCEWKSEEYVMRMNVCNVGISNIYSTPPLFKEAKKGQDKRPSGTGGVRPTLTFSIIIIQ